MKIEKDKMVSIHYTLTNDEGKVLDSSEGKTPLEYIHGNNMLIGGLEAQLEGKEEGDRLHCVIEPKDAYGEFDERLVVEVPRKQFDESVPIEVGMAFQAETVNGGYMLVRVTKVEDKTVTVDGNHELAGQRLTFDVEVIGVRDATEDELAGLGGCGCGCGGGCEGGCGGNCGGDCGNDGGCNCENGGCGNCSN